MAVVHWSDIAGWFPRCIDACASFKDESGRISEFDDRDPVLHSVDDAFFLDGVVAKTYFLWLPTGRTASMPGRPEQVIHGQHHQSWM